MVSSFKNMRGINMNSSDKFDYKKEYRDLYIPKDKPSLVQVPPMNFVMIDGEGDPNGREFEEVVGLLYAITFTIKMSKKGDFKPEGYFEYVVPPLEGLWGTKENCFSLDDRDNWKWTIMIRQPEFVTNEVFEWAKAEVKNKKGLNSDRARFEVFDEGLCVQAMHKGPYSKESETMEKIYDFIKKEELIDRVVLGERHHEIYLSDPRKVKPENMRTVLRHPVKKEE